MKRTAKEWAALDAEALSLAWFSHEPMIRALNEAKADILKMAEVLRFIGYPVPGDPDSVKSCCAATEYVRANFTLSELDKTV